MHLAICSRRLKQPTCSADKNNGGKMEHMQTLPDTEDQEEVLLVGYLIRINTLYFRKKSN